MMEVDVSVMEEEADDVGVRFAHPNLCGLAPLIYDFQLPANVSSGWERYPKSIENPCFAAGTLAHTKKGLKPIESIQVGDWVLSRPEGGIARVYSPRNRPGGVSGDA
ncbi:MAG: Hint domain-containing protein [Candidatus Accumulibacter sp.]|jgi:hypothetical protein|nr:Hint domain-containing protein [Accumulibacter sp.]